MKHLKTSRIQILSRIEQKYLAETNCFNLHKQNLIIHAITITYWRFKLNFSIAYRELNERFKFPAFEMTVVFRFILKQRIYFGT